MPPLAEKNDRNRITVQPPPPLFVVTTQPPISKIL